MVAVKLRSQATGFTSKDSMPHCILEKIPVFVHSAWRCVRQCVEVSDTLTCGGCLSARAAPVQAPKSISAILRPLEILTRPLPAHLRTANLADPELTPQVRAHARQCP